MSPLSPAIALLIAALASPVPALAAPAAAEQSILRQRAAEALAVLQGTREATATFGERFLAAVPAAKFAALSHQLQAENGKLVAIEDVRATGSNSGTFRLRFERAAASGTIALEGQAPFKISGFWIGEPLPLDDSMAKITQEFATLPGHSGFAVVRLGDDKPTTIAAAHAGEQFAIGSTFKLWVLDALAEEIEAGRHRWDEVVTLDHRSLPSGQTQDWPANASVTVETLATLMISISDNTATDALIGLIGRERVADRIHATGHGDPARMLPLLTTAEAFALKLSPSLSDAYAGADEAGQAHILAGLHPYAVLAGANSAVGDGEPAAIDSAEWFASPDDIARVLDTLRRRSDPRVLAILGVAPGLTSEWHEGFAYLGFKGGSETGVENLSWLVRKPSGGWYAVTASWNNPKAAIDEDHLRQLGRRLLRAGEAGRVAQLFSRSSNRIRRAFAPGSRSGFVGLQFHLLSHRQQPGADYVGPDPYLFHRRRCSPRVLAAALHDQSQL